MFAAACALYAFTWLINVFVRFKSWLVSPDRELAWGNFHARLCVC
jgi:hypothetical protein